MTVDMAVEVDTKKVNSQTSTNFGVKTRSGTARSTSASTKMSATSSLLEYFYDSKQQL
jgi:hypothetical protein